MNPSPIFDQHRDAIVEVLAPVRPLVVYLFGSRGMGRERPDSDFDVAVLCHEPLDPMRRFALAGDLAGRLGTEVDLVDLAEASTVMAKEVLRTGTHIAVADVAAMREFEMRTLADYARLNEERQPVLESLS